MPNWQAPLPDVTDRIRPCLVHSVFSLYLKTIELVNSAWLEWGERHVRAWLIHRPMPSHLPSQ